MYKRQEHIIRKTFEALKGCKNAIVHVYNSTSYAQRQQVFKKSKEDLLTLCIGSGIVNVNDSILAAL